MKTKSLLKRNYSYTNMIEYCRVCKQDFFQEPLLRLEDMPKGAQHLPETSLLANEKGVVLEVYQCSKCGLVQLNNEPVPYYKEVIRASAFSQEMKEFRIKQFDEFVRKYSLANKKVIEIGAGQGEYLSLMKNAGTDAYGTEYSEESAKQCLKENLKVSRIYLDSEEDKIEDAPFDAFFILNFFEHIPDPNSALKAVYNNLSEGGIGLIEVPNFDMILRNNLFAEFIGDHLLYFTKKTLSSTLERNGFEIIECNEIWHDYIISAVVRKRKKIDISRFKNHRTKITREIKEYVSRFGSHNVAVYGAGHQALAIISLTNIKNDIKYVVDDAPFKQGRYTPATHVPIVSPEKLITEPVEAIMIMAASYSDEVANKIQQKFNNNMNVAILRDYGLEFV